jgi:prepilin-type N-terminal cleavage/methylation domain-containing protein
MKRDKTPKGFTLIEILIVLVIVGIGVFTIVPKITERKIKPSPELDFFNNLLEQHYILAKQNGKPVYFKGFKGSENFVTYEGKTVKLPFGTVSSIKINGKAIEKLEFKIYVYPDKISDYFKITLSNDEIIEAIPLLLKVRKIKTE